MASYHMDNIGLGDGLAPVWCQAITWCTCISCFANVSQPVVKIRSAMIDETILPVCHILFSAADRMALRNTYDFSLYLTKYPSYHPQGSLSPVAWCHDLQEIFILRKLWPMNIWKWWQMVYIIDVTMLYHLTIFCDVSCTCIVDYLDLIFVQLWQ